MSDGHPGNFSHPTPPPQKNVTIAGETGVRIVDRTIQYTPVAVWPKDSADQRMWALNLVVSYDQFPYEEMFERAQQVIDWINTGRDES